MIAAICRCVNHDWLSLFTEKLSESLKLQRFPVACTQAFLLFRVLLLKCCHINLMSFWPTMTIELVQLCVCVGGERGVYINNSSLLFCVKVHVKPQAVYASN